jgi:hypothetical protein
VSQRHAGWIALSDMYDDGGLSGFRELFGSDLSDARLCFRSRRVGGITRKSPNTF